MHCKTKAAKLPQQRDTSRVHVAIPFSQQRCLTFPSESSANHHHHTIPTTIKMPQLFQAKVKSGTIISRVTL
jgi:hypothetical protein